MYLFSFAFMNFDYPFWISVQCLLLKDLSWLFRPKTQWHHFSKYQMESCPIETVWVSDSLVDLCLLQMMLSPVHLSGCGTTCWLWHERQPPLEQYSSIHEIATCSGLKSVVYAGLRGASKALHKCCYYCSDFLTCFHYSSLLCWTHVCD